MREMNCVPPVKERAWALELMMPVRENCGLGIPITTERSVSKEIGEETWGSARLRDMPLHTMYIGEAIGIRMEE